MKTNLLFDLDGTLADPFLAFKNSMTYSFEKNSLPPPTDAMIRKCIGPPLHISLEKIFGLSPFMAAQVMLDYRIHHSEHCVQQYVFYAGARETLTALQAKYKLFVATSKPHSFAIPILRNFGFDIFFKKIYGSELDGLRSQKTDLIQYILESENLNPMETLMIGDREHDAIGARNNQVTSIGVLWGFGSIEELKAAGTAYQAKDWPDLLSYITKPLV